MKALKISLLIICSVFCCKSAFAKPVASTFTEKMIGGGTMDIIAEISKKDFRHNDPIKISVNADITSPRAKEVIQTLDGLYLLIRAERAFDKQGQYHQFSNNYASTVLTPSGLPIENHDVFSNYTNAQVAEYRNEIKPENRLIGYSHATPFDRVIFLKKDDLKFANNRIIADFTLSDKIPKNLPEGYYRFQVSILAKKENLFYRVNFLPVFSSIKPFFSDWDMAILARNCSYLPIIKIGDPKQPKMIWTLFTKQYSNGMQGIVAEEDKNNFQFNSRHVVPADFILPAPSHHQKPITLKLEPDFPTMMAKNVVKLEQGEKWEFQTPLPIDYTSGQLKVEIITPDGTIKTIGPKPFKSKSMTGATTLDDDFEYTFEKQGKYTVKMSGEIMDIFGNKYTGGGTYNFWVANRLTFVTSIKPGSPFTVGEGYPPSAIVHPPCPADIRFDITLYRNSDKNDTKHVTIEGKANRFGYFYPRDKYDKMIFDSPGEYLSTITASYTDPQGNLWMGSQHNGSIVAPKDSPLIVHGASPLAHNMAAFEKRGNINYEGLIATSNNPEVADYTVCTLFPFPYYAGDVMYIANSFAGDNGIVPALKASFDQEIMPGIKDDVAPFSTSTNGFQPQGYPEFLDKQCYSYMSAIRSGFLARYMIAQDTNFIWDSYWQSGANFAGEQINNSYNGDLPQDIYGFIGGIVYRDYKTNKNQYGIYASMGVIIPKGSFANRIVAPFTEPLVNINGRDHYLTDVGAPLPGMIYETTDILRAGAMIMPPVKGVDCTRIVTTPSGKIYHFKGTTNDIGLAKLVAEEGAEIPVTEPGVYKVKTQCKYKDLTGDLIGSGDGNYYIYAVDKDDQREYFSLDLPEMFRLDHRSPFMISGKVDENITDAKMYYTLLMPGMLMDEGILPVKDYRFCYNFLARDFAVEFPQYDITKYNDPNVQMMADTVIFTFFLTGKDQQGKDINCVKRFVLRGEKGVVLK